MDGMDDPVFASAVFYRDPKAAVAWLTAAFDFTTTMAIEAPPEDPAMSHYEMAAPSGGRVMIGGQWADWTRSPADLDGANTQTVHVHLAADLDAHCERARRAGAIIEAEPADQFYGDRTYRAVDLEGHCWTFAQHVRDVTRAEAEEAIGQAIVSSTWD